MGHVTPARTEVPVIRDVQKLSFADIEKEIVKYGNKAKKGSLTVRAFRTPLFLTRAYLETAGACVAQPLLLDAPIASPCFRYWVCLERCHELHVSPDTKR